MKKPIFILVSVVVNTPLYSQSWQSVGNGTHYYARCIHADTSNNLLYVGGTFAYADTVKVNGIGAWNGFQWLPVGRGDTSCTGTCDNPLASIDQLGNNIYVGGFFQTMGGASYTRFLAGWDGINWFGLGNVNSQIGLKTLNNKIYAMGLYGSIGGIPAYSIASWDGIQWEDVHAFPDDPWGGVNVMTAVEMYNGELYVGGTFNILNNRKNIAKWDGTDWVSLQNGIPGGLAYVDNLVTYNNELYVGGWFTKADGNAGNFLMVWNGSNWREFSPLVNYGGPVFDMKIIDNQLYIIGAFNFVGDTTEYGMAKYDGTIFSAFGGANNWAYQIAGLNHQLYVITDDVIGTDTVHYVAQWMGGNQIDSSVTVLAGITNPEKQNNLKLYPNPATDQITIEFDLADTKNVSLEIKNIEGRTIKTITKPFFIRKNQIHIDLTEFTSGLYFIQIKTSSATLTRKIIKI
jgi:hypothetical protein